MNLEPEKEKPDKAFPILLIIVIVGATIFYYFSEIRGPCKPQVPDPDCPDTHELRIMGGTPICKCLPED
jgi:hypothetical protein